MPHQTSCLQKFLTYPTAPSKLPTLKPKSSGRVLTSADSIRDLEEKKRKKEEKAIKKEENAKKREERSRKKNAEQIEREERARKKKAEQSKRKQSSKSPALGKVCLYHLGSQHNMYCQSIQLLLLTTRAKNVVHLLCTILIKRPSDPSSSRIRRLGHEASYTFYKENNSKAFSASFTGREMNPGIEVM